MAEEDGSSKFDPNVNYDDKTLAQQREIEKEIANTQALIGQREAFSVLEKEYEKDAVYLTKVSDVKSKYRYLRRTRGDGNCFFRAFGFAYFERMLTDLQEYERFKSVAEKSKDELVHLGFPSFTIEDFHETFMEVVEKVGQQCPLDQLIGTFNDQGISDYLVVYLRLLTSGQLQKEHDYFVNFIDGERTVKEFCNQEVEPMCKESDNIHITGLTQALGVAVRIVYMDRVGDGNVQSHTIPSELEPKVHLLYRPGHYDILYE